MVNGRAWNQDELAQITSMLEHGGYLQKLAQRLDRTPEAILLRAHKALKAQSGNKRPPSARITARKSELSASTLVDRIPKPKEYR